MIKTELREVKITYCDYCKEEITPPYTSIEYQNGLRIDLCSEHKDGEKSCKEKYLYEERFKPKS